jgi:hypothetical protein
MNCMCLSQCTNTSCVAPVSRPVIIYISFIYSYILYIIVILFPAFLIINKTTKFINFCFLPPCVYNWYKGKSRIIFGLLEVIQHGSICRLSDSTVSVDAGIEPWAVATFAHSNHSARSHLEYYWLISVLYSEDYVHSVCGICRMRKIAYKQTYSQIR